MKRSLKNSVYRWSGRHSANRCPKVKSCPAFTLPRCISSYSVNEDYFFLFAFVILQRCRLPGYNSTLFLNEDYFFLFAVVTFVKVSFAHIFILRVFLLLWVLSLSLAKFLFFRRSVRAEPTGDLGSKAYFLRASYSFQ